MCSHADRGGLLLVELVITSSLLYIKHYKAIVSNVERQNRKRIEDLPTPESPMINLSSLRLFGLEKLSGSLKRWSWLASAIARAALSLIAASRDMRRSPFESRRSHLPLKR